MNYPQNGKKANALPKKHWLQENTTAYKYTIIQKYNKTKQNYKIKNNTILYYIMYKKYNKYNNTENCKYATILQHTTLQNIQNTKH